MLKEKLSFVGYETGSTCDKLLNPVVLVGLVAVHAPITIVEPPMAAGHCSIITRALHITYA